MSDPLTALLFALVAAAAGYVLFRPRTGWFWRIRQSLGVSERVRKEDALKHLHESEYEGRLASVESLAGVLGLSRGAAAELIKELIARGFAMPGEDGYVLSPSGRSYALQVIRAHRLWERYLADETGIPPAEIHERAERAEHRLTREEADELEARLGFPSHDPHGDPIPSADGALVDRDGVPLTRWPQGLPARIVHLEDEPPEVYAQLMAVGVRLGLDIRILERTPEQVRFFTEDDEFVVATVVAANITVDSPPREAVVEGPYRRLSELSQGETARVLGLDEYCRGLTRRRFMDLGLTPGTRVEVDRSGPFKDPRAYRIRGTLIALRREQADQILVEPLEASARNGTGSPGTRREPEPSAPA
jgi:DtxR family Mn-dependent transcriptional regulator